MVWDEADKMLGMGFGDQLVKIMKCVRTDKQMLMFSATWPRKVRELANQYMLKDDGDDSEVVQCCVGQMDQHTANPNVEQQFIFCTEAEKLDHLERFLRKNKYLRSLIFVERMHKSEALKRALKAKDFRAVECIHGNCTQKKREWLLAAFKRGQIHHLIATDVASRGLHIDGIDFVINFDLPGPRQDFEDYVHRIGRTARAGKYGTAISYFVEPLDTVLRDKMVAMLQTAKQKVPERLMTMKNQKDSIPGNVWFQLTKQRASLQLTERKTRKKLEAMKRKAAASNALTKKQKIKKKHKKGMVWK